MSNIGPCTRRKLYEMVWAEPVEDVAARFGLSGRGLGKLCERHSIPVPPRGYWQKKAAGRRAIKPPLLIEADDEIISSLLRRAKATPSPSPKPDTDDPSKPTPDTFAAIYAAQIAACPEVPCRPKRKHFHPIIEGWTRRLRLDVYASRTFRRPSNVTLESEAAERTHERICALLDALFIHLEKQGFKITSEGNPATASSAMMRSTVIRFSLVERIRQYRRPVTEEEKESHFYGGQKFHQVREPTGELLFKISSPTPGKVPRQWQDEQDKPLENRLHEVAAGFAVAVAYELQRRTEEAEARERQRLAEEEQQRQKRARELEAERRQKLRQSSEAWHEAMRLRAFIEAVRQSEQNGRFLQRHLPLDDWCEWASSVADQIDPLAGLKQSSYDA